MLISTSNALMKTDYNTFIQDLAEKNQTTGENKSDAYINYTQLSARRMKRWDKVGKLLPETIAAINNITQKQKWVVLTESWCGDAAHAYMFIQKMADLNENIELEWKLRDENLGLMDQYLTNGGRSIPKLIAFDEHQNELFNWGPRPKHIQEAYLKMREENLPYDELSVELQKLYNADKGESMQKELLKLMS